MTYYDLPLEQLKTYLPKRTEEADFDSFWQASLAEARQTPMQARFEPVQTGLTAQDFFDVTYPGFGGQPIKGWLVLPHQRSRKLPCVVEFIGYNGGRSFPTDWLLWASAGYAHFVMDTRGQGSTWSHGDTPDLASEGTDPHAPGFLTMGILDPARHYYRRVFTDAVRAIEAARSHPEVDAAHIAAIPPSTRSALPSPAAARAAGSPWLPPGSTRALKSSCRMCRSCATTAGPARSPIRIPTRRLSSTAIPTATTSRRSSAPCPTSMGSTWVRVRAARRSSLPA